MCESMINSIQTAETATPLSIATAIYEGMNLFANYTGDVKCFDLDSDVPADINMVSWTYQVKIQAKQTLVIHHDSSSQF